MVDKEYMKQEAVIYDKWLATLGGGEVVACSFAKALQEKYKVTLVSDTPVEPKRIQERLGVDLTGVTLKTIWFDESKLYELTNNKELFINVSFMDYSYGCAQKNIYYVYFPSGNLSSWKSRVKDTVLLPFLSRFFSFMPLYTAAFPVQKNGKVAYEIKKKPLSFTFSKLQPHKSYVVTIPFFLESFSFSQLENIEIELESAKEEKRKILVNHRTNTVMVKIVFTAKNQSQSIRVVLPRIENDSFSRVTENYVLEPYIEEKNILPYLSAKIIRRVQQRLRAGVYTDLEARLNSYNLILSDSQFAQHEVTHFWNRRSFVLYPPVKLLPEKNQKKRNQIVSIGRFFTLGHGKKQEVMIAAFRKFFTRGNTGWELHLVGGVDTEDLQTIEYIRELKRLSRGLPVFFHFNVSRSELESIVSTSKIYWHAAGYKEKLAVKKEHFGISVVEAISGGCLPIVLNEGGLPEIIQELRLPKKKHVFHSLEQLIMLTEYWIRNYSSYKPPERKLMNDTFSNDRFERECRELVDMGERSK